MRPREIPAKNMVRGAEIPVWVRAREYTHEALGIIAEIMRDQQAAGGVRLQASGMLLDRAWGKAPVIVLGDEERPITLDVRAITPDLRGALEEALRGALVGGIADAIAAPPRPGDAATIINATAAPASGGIDAQAPAISPPVDGTKGQHIENASLIENEYGE